MVEWLSQRHHSPLRIQAVNDPCDLQEKSK